MKYLLTLLNIIFPRPYSSCRFDTMTAEQFLAQAKMCLSPPDSSLEVPIESIFEYRDPFVHDAIWELKYNGNKKVAQVCAEILYDHIQEFLSEEYLYSQFTQPLLIPIPSSQKRLHERGWNQTEILAFELEKLDKNKLFRLETKILEKTIHTEHQTKLSRAERLKNLKNCFKISPHAKNVEKIKNRNIILLDDVTTTGSTLKEAARVLKESGSHTVHAFTIAH